MSLIVANVTSYSLFLLSDTKLTYRQQETNPYIEGGIKTTILNYNRCIAFAGAYEFAQETIQNIQSSDSNEDILQTLISATTTDKVEFIFATIEPCPQIIKINNGIEQSCISAWIGDFDAFSLYQSFYTECEDSNSTNNELTRFQILKMPDGCPEADRELYSKMFTCMSAVIDSTEVDTVAGFTIPVITDNGVLKFGRYCSIFRCPIEQHEVSQSWAPISFGDASTGSFSVNFAEMSQRKIAIHIEQGQLGIVFDSDDSLVLEPKLLTNIDEIDFAELMRERFNGSLCTLIASSPGHFFKKAEGFMKNNNFSRAMLLLTQGIRNSSKAWKGSPHNPNFCYESLCACLENEGPPLQIPSEEVSNLKFAFFMRGFCHFANQNYQSALQDFRESLTLDGQYYNALLWRARSEHALGDNAAAIETIKKCCALHSKYEAFQFCGQLLQITNEISEAKSYFLKAQELASS